MNDKLTFQTHPLKSDIIKRWDNNESNTHVHEWLKAEHPNVILSVATLCKHYARYQFNKKHIASSDKSRESDKKKKKALPIETILWETVQQCRRKKRDKTISVKDWQYLDQQLQAAIEKLMRIQGGGGGDERDISNILAEIFGKLESGEELEFDDLKPKELSDEEKLKIAQEVDDEAKVETTVSSEAS